MDIEPALADSVEGGLYDLLKSSNPTGLAAIVPKGSDA
jgi:hypothetical protein